MALSALRTDERVGLGVAVLLHVALVAVLVLQPGKDEVPPLPPRMTVSLTSDVSLASTAPDPVSESRAAIAPTLSDEPQPAPIEQAQPEPIPAPRAVATTPPPRAAPTRTAAKTEPERRRPD
ncbi:MAG: energy transducer TonB, partial [Allopontixanthobacter sediminis]